MINDIVDPMYLEICMCAHNTPMIMIINNYNNNIYIYI